MRVFLFQKGEALVLFLCGKKKNEKEAASASLDLLCKKEPRSTPQRTICAAGDLVPCGTDCRRKDRYGVWLSVCRARTAVRPPAPAGAKPISRRRRPRCVFALQCSALHCDKEKTRRKAQTGIKPLSALPCCRGLHSEACANTCREQRVKANLLHRSDRPERSRILFVLFPSEQEKNTFPPFR